MSENIETIEPPKSERKSDVKKEVESPKVIAQPVFKQPQTEPKVNANITKERETPASVVDPIKVSMSQYLNALRTAKNDNELGAANRFLYNVLVSILRENSFITFKQKWTAVLDFVKIYHEDISALNMNAALYATELTPKQLEAYTVLTFLIVKTYNPKERFRLMNVCPDKISKQVAVFSPKAAINLITYYKLD